MRKRIVEIYDSVRETEQTSLLSGVMTAEGIIKFVRHLHEFGIPWIEGPWPVPQRKAEEEGGLLQFEKAQEFYRLLQAENPELKRKIVAFGSTMDKNVSQAKESPVIQNLAATGLNNFCIFGKSWAEQVHGVLKTSLGNNLQMVEKSVKFLKSRGGKVFFDLEHFFDGFKYDRKKSLSQNYAVKVMLAAVKAGADVIVFCDTNGGTLIDEAREILEQAVPLLNGLPWGVHFHDDEGLAKANTLMAIDLGANFPQVTTLGHGERIGMPRLTDLVPTLILKKRYRCLGIEKLDNLTEFAKISAAFLGERLGTGLPYVGSAAYGHKAGTHLRNPRLQEHVVPEKVGNTRFRQISALLGPRGIREALKEVGIHLKKDNPLIKKVHDKVKKMDAKGIHIGSAKGSFALLALRRFPDYKAPFVIKEIEPYSLFVNRGKHKYSHVSRASLEIELPDNANATVSVEVYKKAESGQVDAIDSVVKHVLASAYPIIHEIRLVDYNVRVLKGNGQGTASKVRVEILADTPYGYYEFFAISENVILASALALTDMYELTILFQKRRRKRKK